MKTHIKLDFYTIPQDKNFNQISFENLKIMQNSLIFLSKRCYSNICNNDFCVRGLDLNSFWIKNENYISISSATIKPIYATDWYLLKSLNFNNTSYNLSSDIFSNILFISYENEFKKKEVNAFFTISDLNEGGPIDFITKDLPEFQNSMFLLTHDSYIELTNTTTTISAYKGIERLTWLYDTAYSYPGGTITLNSMKDNCLYFIENMNFSFFTKTFSITGFPNTLYFII